MELQIGGKRLGAGGKMTQEVREYERSTFNQSFDWKSSMAPGILYPFMCIPMTNGDTADIDIDAYVCTLPTKGPLFGSFKLQADIFSIPLRLYNGILHNNPIDIGMKMNQIYMPKLRLEFDETAPRLKGSNMYNWQINNTSLLKYLGLSGIGVNKIDNARGKVERKINAIPILGYYDIFKNYYANKQEKNAYVIEPNPDVIVSNITFNSIKFGYYNYDDAETIKETITVTEGDNKAICNGEIRYFTGQSVNKDQYSLTIYGWNGKNINRKNMYLTAFDENINILYKESLESLLDGVDITDKDSYSNNIIYWQKHDPNVNGPSWYVNIYKWINLNNQLAGISSDIDSIGITVETTNEGQVTSDIVLKPFELENIDNMRNCILQITEVGHEFIIGDGDNWDIGDGGPYNSLINKIKVNNKNISYNSFIENGLVVKTYQADIFNNWIDTEWIEGENGIAAITAVDVSEGTLEMDALLLSQKVYNMLNRIAASGGTWDDYQEVVWTEKAVRKAETPIYEGGMSGEVMFEQVISSSETKVDGEFQALGSLGGKGVLAKQNGGHNIHIEAKEPIFVMGIVSLTPRICYTQGNEWYLTELDTFDDLHKPALDGIGFQDLIQEQMAWWNTQINNGLIVKRDSAGKIVAWSNYMTNYDKAFGDFAEPEGKGFMVLSRNYERAGEDVRNAFMIRDMTTYIDPAKYNYAFAYTDLAAQNFWVQLANKVIVRRKMSAHQIPNL